MKTRAKISIKKTMTTFVLAAVLLLSSTLICYAEEVMDVGLVALSIEENIMTLQVTSTSPDRTKPIDYAVEVDGKEMPMLSVNAVVSEGAGVSYLFLVDISGSMSNKKVQDVKEVLTGIINGMKETDNACLMLLGNDTYSGSFESDKETLLAQIETIEASHEDTNLYYGITNALNVLGASNSALDRKVLVVLSDGQDVQVKGITQKEVEDAIDKAGVTIYTVATLEQNDSAELQESAKLLGSFARRSPGGAHFLPGVEDMTAEIAARLIVDSVDNSLIVKVDMTGFQTSSSEVYIEVIATSEQFGTASNGRFVPAATLQKGLVEKEPETNTPEESAEETGDEEQTGEAANEEQKDDTNSKNMTVWIIVGIAAAVAVIAVFLTIKNNEKKKAKEAAQKANQKAKEQKKPDKEEKQPKTAPSKNAETEKGKTIQPEKQSNQKEVPTLSVTLTKVGLIETEKRELQVGERLVLGRSSEKADVAFKDDVKMSGRHCVLSYDGDKLSVEDEGSTNGTFVNGVQIQQKFFLNSDDVLTLGESEWRVNFKV